MATSSERVVLIDGSSLIFAAYYALPSSFVTSAGLPTNAVFGFTNTFRKLLAGRTPTLGAVVFDAPGKTFRDEKYPDYKANRSSMPGDLARQLPYIDRVVEAFNFPMLRVPGFEADDVIGTLARQAEEAGHEVFIVSKDKDFAQLISDRVRMWDTLGDVTYDPELVRKKWGVPPERFIDWLALVGDKIDNVPGVPGIGKKGAAQLLETYGDLETLLAHVDELKGRQRTTLAESADLARLCKELVTIETHVPLEVSIADLRLPAPDPDALNALFVELEFFSLISESARDALSQAEEATRYRVAESVAAVRELVAALPDDPAPALATVYEVGPPAVSPLVGVAIATAPGEAIYVPLRAPAGGLGDAGLAALAPWLADPARPKVAHDLKRAWLGLRRAGVSLAGVTLDTRLASFLIDPTGLIPHRLDQLTKEYLQRTVRPAKSVIGSGKGLQRFGACPVEEVAGYLCHRADAVVTMAPRVAERLAAAGQEAQLRERDLPLSYVLGEMELVGIKVDVADLERLGAELRERRDAHERRIWELAGREFNVGSPKQLGAVLFDELSLPVVKRTKTGYSTNEEVMERLAPLHPIAEEVLAWRMLAKLINTYTDVLAASVHEADGRIHTTFQQTAGATGRLITTDPDLQRTPVTTPEGRRIRRAFVAEPGWRIISADWSQIELRLLAHFTADPALVEAFRTGADVHARTAGAVFGVAPGDVTRAQRAVGKTVNFATIYGQGATALGQQLGVPRAEAKRYITSYFKAYAGVRRWIDETVAAARERGFVTTLHGRRRIVRELTSNNPMDRAYGERIAANTPIQGSAADLCKQVMLEIPPRLRAAGLRTRMLLQIHDELVFEAPVGEVEAASAIIRERMEHTVDLAVPLIVDLGVGASWAEAH